MAEDIILFCITKEDIEIFARRMGIDPTDIDFIAVKTVLEWGIETETLIKSAISNSVMYDSGFTGDYCASS